MTRPKPELRFDMDFGQGRAIYTRTEIIEKLQELKAAKQTVDDDGMVTVYDTSDKRKDETP